MTRLSYCLFAAVLRLLVFSAVQSMLVASYTMAQTQQLQVLQRHVHREVTDGHAAFYQRMQTDKAMHLSIVLPLRNQAALSALLSQLYDPSSTNYRHFLTVEQFTEQFAPTPEDYQAVASFARSNGFTVGDAPRNRMVVPISGSVDQVNKAFHVMMNLYQHPDENRIFFSPDREPSLSLSVPVAHIAGLNDFTQPHRPTRMVQDGEQADAVTGSGPGNSYLASDMRAAYYGGTKLDGTGQSIGILEFGGYALSDVNLTFANAGQTYSVPVNNVLLDGATGAPSSNDSEEVLDIVQAIGMAPGLDQVRVYIGIGSDDANILNSMASENIAKQLSCSWGWRPDDPTAADVFFQEMAAQGQSFFTASGDSGAYDVSINPYFYPADDAYVTTVGGTHLATNGAGGTWAGESAWTLSGGGISQDGIGIPSWQNGIANAANGGSTILRNVPDVAMEADQDNYYCTLGQCGTVGGGTSFAAPRWAGYMALVNQQAVENGSAVMGGIGFINPSLYRIAQEATTAGDLHDVTTGNNRTSTQAVWYNAVAGYDLVTGWGSANGQSLIDDLAGPEATGFWVRAAQRTLTVNPGNSVTSTITIQDAGGFTGPVALSITGLPAGVTASWSANPASDSSVLTLIAAPSAIASVSTLTITGTSGSLSATSTLTLSVHAPSFLLSAVPSNVGMAQSATATSTILVTPQYGFSASVALSVSGLPAGVTASFSPASTSGTSTLTFTSSSAVPGGTSTVTVTGTSGSLTASTTIPLTIHAPTFTLNSVGSADIGQGAAVTSYVYLTSQYGFTGSVNLAVSGLPSGVTASITPNPLTGSSMLTLMANSTATVGSSTITVTGTSGTITAKTTILLTVHVPTFQLSTASISVGQGNSATTYVSIQPQYGFTSGVALSVSGLPSGVTAYWSPNPTTGTSILTVHAATSVPTGQYPLTITGTNGSASATVPLTLSIFKPTFILSTQGSYNLGQGSTGSSFITVSPQYGFTGSVSLSASGLPAGVTASFSPNAATGSSSITLTASSTAAIGQYPLTITGVSGGQTVTTTLNLGIYQPTFTLSTYAVSVSPGATIATYVYVSPQYGFTGAVNLSVSGLPAGITGSFSPASTTSSSALTLNVASTVPVGQYTATVTGTSGGRMVTASLPIYVYAPSFSIIVGSPYLAQGSSTTTYANVSWSYGAANSVNLGISGLPAGVTASFSPSTLTGSAVSSTLTFNVASNAVPGSYPFTVTGTSGSLVETTTPTLTIVAPTYSIYANSATLAPGSSSATAITLTSSYGFVGNVQLALSNLPAGVTASFATNPITLTSSSYSLNDIVTVTANSSAALGSTNVTLTATSGGITKTANLLIVVQPQSFTLSSGTLTLNEGQSGSLYINGYGQVGYSGNVALSVTGLPAGVTGTFSQNPLTFSNSNANSTLTLAAGAAVTPGSYPLTITGTSGALTATTASTLTINNPIFTLADSPSLINLPIGASRKTLLSITPQYAFSGAVNFSATDLPKGVTATFSPNPATGTSALTLVADSTAAAGKAFVTVTGISGNSSASLLLPVSIYTTTPSSTSLQLSSGGNPTASIAVGSAVTATVTVSAGSSPVSSGQVRLCDAAAANCDDVALIGTAQITGSGTATLHFTPGPGSHSYKAVFPGTNVTSPSTSNAVSLAVNGNQPTATSIAQSGSAGNYILTATVTGSNASAPSGNVSFLDTTNNNASIGSASLSQTSTAYSTTSSQISNLAAPRSVVTADFNGDGIADLAVANGTGAVTLLQGVGDGTFKAPVSIPVGGEPYALVVGDFNQDGRPDLGAPNLSAGNVSILLNNGDGTFNVQPTGSLLDPEAMAVGDFNNDGIPDLAVGNFGTYALSILIGNGDGTFFNAGNAGNLYYEPLSIAVGDLNGDGTQDIVYANEVSAVLLFGNGDGTFVSSTLPYTTAAPTAPIAVSIGDLNRDGRPDLLVEVDSGLVLSFLGNGDGTFTQVATLTLARGSSAAPVIADFDHDGIPDVAGIASGTNAVVIFFGKGDGTFTRTSSFASQAAQSLATGDWNGDGIPDLVTDVLQTGTTSGIGNLVVLQSQLAQTASGSASGLYPIGQGQHAILASYPGDVAFKGSQSSTTSLQAQPGPTALPTVTVNATPGTILDTQSEAVTVTVGGSSGQPVPTGTVTIMSGAYNVTQTLENGAASFNVPPVSLAVGADVLTVIYNGDAVFTKATGTTTVTVVPIVVSAPSAFTAMRGSTATATVTITASSSYSGTLSLSCAVTSSPSGAQNIPTCTPNPASTAISARGTATSSFTFSTTAASASLIMPSLGPGAGLARVLAALFLVFLIPSRRRCMPLLLTVLVSAALLVQTGCADGGGNSNSGGTTTTTTASPGTTVGTYTYTITATDAGAKVTQSTVVALTVQ